MLRAQTMPLAQSGDVPRTLSYQGALADKSGKALDSETVSMIVHLYSDDQGKTSVWEGAYSPLVSKGLFNIQLGSGNFPLPKSETMGHALWLGISVNGSSELRPLTAVAASAYALNVADSAITARKMGTDYVSSVQINGQQVTSRGGALNFVPGQGISMQYDSGAGGLLINTQRVSQPTPIGTNYWAELGNTGTTSGTNFVGNSDSVALEIHVNDAGTASSAGRVMVFYPYAASPDIVGGYKGNLGASGEVGNAISGGGYASNINWAKGNYGFIGGGANNTLLYDYCTIAGGSTNTAGGGYADAYAFIGGGYGNTSAGYGAIGGGSANQTGNYGVVGGGETNWDLADHDFIGGGGFNQIASNYTSGENFDVIAGGETNKISPTLTANAVSSTIAGGLQNSIVGSYSAIAGGQHLTLGNNSFGYNGDNSGTTTTLTTHVGDNVAYFGNVNLMLGNVDGTARQLQFYSSNSGGYLYPSTSYYTSFKAGVQTASIPYILPLSAAPTSVYNALLNDGTGQLLWGDASLLSGSWKIIGNNDIVDGTNFLGTTTNVAVTLRANNLQVLRLEPQSGSPNLIGGYGGNSVVGAVGSVIGGGGNSGSVNTISSNYGVIAGGADNTIAYSLSYPAQYSFIGGGLDNTITTPTPIFGDVNNNYAVIVGGFKNTASEQGTFIGAGDTNMANEDFNVIVGGSGNVTDDQYCLVVGGAENTANGLFDAVVGGNNNYVDHVARNAVITGGIGNTIGPGSAGQGFFAGANIPGGQGLVAQNYCQTVIGYYNIPRGSGNSSYTDIPTSHYNFPNDPIFIIGNGNGKTRDPNQYHNAFEVSNSGYSTVYDNTGAGSPSVAVPTSPATRGGTNNDNVVYAWGDVTVTGPDIHGNYAANLSDSYGVPFANFNYIPPNTFQIKLNLDDEYGGSSVNLAYLSPTATIEGDGNTCGVITTQVTGSNVFKVYTHDLSCNRIPISFAFKVCGRP